MLLQILDDGILTDSQGRRVDFKNCIIIMTSNVGAKLISGSGKALGFSSERGNVPNYDRVRELVMKELKNTFRPEFLNRVDDIIVFHSLEKQDISEIARRMLETLSKRVAQLDITLIFDESAVQKTANAGFDPVYGARPLKRVIQQQIEDKLSEQMLEGKVTTGKKYICKAENGEFVLRSRLSPSRKKSQRRQKPNKTTPEAQAFGASLCGLFTALLLYLEKRQEAQNGQDGKDNTVSY